MLSQFFPPHLGGEERYVYDLCLELAARGHDVAVATLWSEGLAKFEMIRGVRVHRIQGITQRAKWLFKNPQKRQAPPFPDPGLVKELGAVLAKERPEIVHAHNWLVHSFLPIKGQSNATLILSLHDYSLVCAKKKLLNRMQLCSGPGRTKCLSCATEHYGGIKGIIIAGSNWASGAIERRAVDMFLPVSQATAFGNGLVGSDLPYQIIPNFIRENGLAADGNLDPFLSKLPEEDFLLFVGALGSHKGVDVLLEAYNGLHSGPPLVLIGYDTSEYPIANSDLPANVFIFRNWPHAAVIHAWGRCLAGIVPSICPETFGIVVIEAMSMGRPVIASSIGGLPEIVVDEENGLLVPPANPEALRAAIQKLLLDESLQLRMREKAKKTAEKFQAHNVVPQIEQVYGRLLQQELTSNDFTGQSSGKTRQFGRR